MRLARFSSLLCGGRGRPLLKGVLPDPGSDQLIRHNLA